MERVRRCPRHGLPPGHALSQPSLTADQARRWADYAESSPVYRRLTEVVASDDELLGVLNRMENLPRHNVLFAGVQFIMRRDGGGDLEAFYPNFNEAPRDLEGIAQPFREFVLEHEPELVEIGRARYTQTNECRRCVALLPAIWACRVDRFHLIDLGTSAGLNLHLDRYRYRWDSIAWGTAAQLELTTEMRGQQVKPRDVEVLSRTGLDLNPIDPADAEDRRWLEALVWPEHVDRLERLRSALDIAARHPVEMIAGDAKEELGPAIDRVPGSDPVVVINSFILNQLTASDQEAIGDVVDERRSARRIHRVSMEWLDSDDPGASLIIDDGSGLEVIGLAQPHGEWLDLYARP